MSELGAFTPPSVTDDDIRWASRQLGLKDDAFFGAAGTDPRAVVLKDHSTFDVAACPGSGKTTVLVAKLAILANKWTYRTRGICVLSHTNVARREIENQLGHTAAGHRLLTYPHYVGTIHSFANTHLAMPWLASLSYPVKVIDTEAVIEKRKRMLNWGTRSILEAREHFDWHKALVATNIVFEVSEKISWGKGPLGKASPTYKELCRVCKASAEEGYFCHEEMLMWAEDLLTKHPSVVEVIRNRYPLLFIDECQDNDKRQAALLHRIFSDGANPVFRQRYGDGNQAIFDRIGDEAPSFADHQFPIAPQMALPNSHRFGAAIACLADPFGLVPCGLVGEGPKFALASGLAEAKHAIFLFRDKAGAASVLSRFADLIFETFSAEEIHRGTFKAIGQVHKNTGDDDFPAHLGHYWCDYNPTLSRREPRPATLLECVQLARVRWQTTGEAASCVDALADAVLRLAALMKNGRDLQRRGERHRWILSQLATSPGIRRDYNSLLLGLGIAEIPPTKDEWTADWQPFLRKIGVAISQGEISADAEKFLQWPDAMAAVDGQEAARRKANHCRFENGGKVVSIQLGSIHSVKGETHTSTLVVETHWNDPNLGSLKEWLLGDKSGAKKSAKRINSRLKLHYVAMTRPSHLLCLAMPLAAFEKDGQLDPAAKAKLEGRGWTVIEI